MDDESQLWAATREDNANGTAVNGILLVSDGYLLLQVVTQPFIA
jgi:hypothetical protein